MTMRRRTPFAIVVSALFVSVAFTARNATTPDMQPKVEVADSIIGSWVLNREKSDDPREVMQEGQQRDGGGRMRGGGGGGGRGGGGRQRGGAGGRPSGVSPEQRQRMQASMRDAMRAAPLIQISRTDSTVTLETPPQGSRILFTDNREVTVPITAYLDSKVKCKWDKNKLVIESQTDAGVKTVYTYEPDGDQLRVNVRIEVRQPRRVVRYDLVYDAGRVSR